MYLQLEAPVKHLVRQRSIGVALAIIALLPWFGYVPVHAAPVVPHLTSRPREFVAYARLAVVRLTAAYYAQVQTAGTTHIEPIATLCTGLGTLVATSGTAASQPATRSFILTDTRLISPVQPCDGVIAASYNQFKTTQISWKLTTITAYLNSAYTSDDALHPQSVALEVDTSAIPTLGGSDAPIVLPLLHEPSYDLPIIQPSATQPSGTTQIIDMGSSSLQPYTQTSIAQTELPTTTTPIETGIAPPPALATPTVISVGTGTPIATQTAAPPATAIATGTTTAPPPATATPASPISLGAPVVHDAGNGIGELSGMVVMNGTTLGVVGIDAINAAIQQAQATSTPGAFDQGWHSGLDAYYKSSATNAKDPNYGVATQQFMALQSSYRDFHGVNPWLASAQAGSPELGATPNATPTPKSPASKDIIPGVPIHSIGGLLTFFAAIVILLLGIIFWLQAITVGRRRKRAQMQSEATATSAAVAAMNGDGVPIESRADPETVSPEILTRTLRPTIPLARNRRHLRLNFHVGALTDAGIRRRGDPNQDNILAVQGSRLHEGTAQPFGLYVVADGMGGHSFGREASTRAIEVMMEHVLQPLLDGKNMTEEAMLELLRAGVERANRELFTRNVRQRADMGTTVTAALVAGDIAHIVNVGDSRTYQFKPEHQLLQITNDHSVVASLVAAGVIQPDDIYTHPKRNQIFRSLGEKDDVQIDTFQVILQPGDRLVLCSDGLWEMIRDPRIEDILRNEPDVRSAAEALVVEANANGGVDNISAVVVGVAPEQSSPNQTGIHIVAGPETITR